MIIKRALVVAVAVWLASAGVSSPFAAASDRRSGQPGKCVITAADGGFATQKGVRVYGACRSRWPARATSSESQPVMRVVSCGVPPVQRRDSNGPQTWNYKQCGRTVKTCTRTDPDGTTSAVTAFVTQTQDPVTKKWTSGAVWCPADSAPVPGTALLRDRALRLLPTVAIGAAGGAGGGTNAVVHTQTILWAQTAAHRDLGRVTVLGQRVWLRIRFASAHWNFGDHTSDTTTSPGKVYDDTTDPCDTAMCPGYYGHVYTTTGTKTITLSVSWTASYSLDGSHYASIGTEPLTGPAATSTITLRQARGVLVADPAGE